MNPLDEAHHVLLVQSLRSSGDRSAAEHQVARCRALLLEELGVEPSPVLAAAAVAPVADPDLSRAASVDAMLAAAEVAVAGGAVSQGLSTLDEAVVVARATGDPAALARVLVAQGHALVHAGRGGDEEGGAALHEAVTRAREAGSDALAATAYRELAFADLQRGRYERARDEAATAARHAGSDAAELAWIRGIEGGCLSDIGRYEEAIGALAAGVAAGTEVHSLTATAFCSSFLGRAHLLRGDLPEARTHLERAVDLCRSGWVAMTPWPESFLAEIELREGDVDSASARFERGFVMGRQLDDPCIESIATRGLGLVARARGDDERAYELLVDAPRLSRRLPDSYLWIEAYGLEALCQVSIEQDADSASRWVDELEDLASRCGMRELLARAMLHRSHLGDRAALEVASDLAESIDNPALDRDVVFAAA